MGWTRPKLAARSISRSRSIARSSHPSPPTSTSPTTSRFARTVVAATGLAVGIAVPVRAQAARATELGVGATVILAHRGFWGPEVGAARPGAAPAPPPVLVAALKKRRPPMGAPGAALPVGDAQALAPTGALRATTGRQ